MRAEDILYFWFTEAGPEKWWQKSTAFDNLIRRKFLHIYEAGAQGTLYKWRSNIAGRLAEIIVLDQFPRNLFRDTPRAFATDGMALVLAQEAVHTGLAAALSPSERAFLYMPYMHSENTEIHTEAVRLFSAPGMQDNLSYEMQHKAIIDRFGRYPHRNDILGRKSTSEEVAFLREPGSSF